ncbi:hypothetical protein CDLVIII_4224 [Clostridium sp. DL-VIII]|uniref:hypothetical protein n=1 Tax=Clostridium sp. DL-VIII TaxID=641107 RepID=UPI00023B0458|nr:hypothetical protein [Clostridium sp. DL-VIII]EHJ00748.1 hypothetical protein CDLVIII_4224 [Clostridium sp. DL-VIII]
MKQNLKDFLFNLAISMAIGIFVGMIQITIKNISEGIVKELIMFSIIGGVIGTISRFIFIYMVAIKQKRAVIAYILVFITIGVISCMPFFYYYFLYSTDISITELVSILITAEFLGMSFCYYSYKKYKDINFKLTSKKKQLLRKN